MRLPVMGDAGGRTSTLPVRLAVRGLAPLAEAPRQFAAGVAVYGNWCGPGHGGPGAPIDPVDRVCQLHDQCYDQRGYLDCSCDRDLVARMPAAVVHPATSPAGKVAGAAAAGVFQATPCLCRRICLPFIGCFSSPIPIPTPPGIKHCPPPFA